MMSLQHVRSALLTLMLTLLIWVFAERQVIQSVELEAQLTLPTARDHVLMELLDEQGNPIPQQSLMVRLRVEGPTRRIQKAQDQRFRIEVPTTIAEVPASGSTDYHANIVKEILEWELPLKEEQGYLKVVSSEPGFLRLRITRLIPQILPVTIRDEFGNELEVASLSPERIETVGLGNQIAEATVTLSEQQRRLAMNAPIEVNARVLYGSRLLDEQKILVQLTESGSALPTDEITIPRWGILNPPGIEGKYRIVIDSGIESAQTPIRIQGPTLAITEYKNSRYHLALEVDEKDYKPGGEPIPRPLRYHLPEEYIKDIEIIDPQQRVVRFHLEPLSP